jgi:phage gp29-like protein
MALELAPGKPIIEEVATVAKDITFPQFQGVLTNRDETLFTRGGSRGIKLYDDLERDARVFSTMQKRKMAILAYEWKITAASTSPADEEVADLVKTQLLNMRSFNRTCLDLGDAILKGFAVGEVMWGIDGNQVVVQQVIARDQRRFVFDVDSKLRLRTLQNMYEGELVPDRKFIVNSAGAKDGSPYGLGLGTRLFWPAFFKRQGIAFWVTFADKYGSPTAVGKYPAGTDANNIAKLMAALNAISQDAGVAIPEGMAIELLEAQKSGAMDGYESLCRYMDEQIAEIVLGESLSTNIGSTGSKAASETHNDVRLELTQADGELLADTLNFSLVRWIVDFNRPGALYPKLAFEIDQGEDLGDRAARDTDIVSWGFMPTLEYVKQTYGGDWVEAPKPPLTLTPPGRDTNVYAETAADKPDQVDKFADQAGDAGAPIVESMVAKIANLLDGASSLAEFQAGLIKLSAGIDPHIFAEQLEKASLASTLAGIFEVKSAS